jgi:geranylgeranyl pyrophosphate synthase
MIFQMADDCMDYEATEQQAQKTCFRILSRAW